MIGKDLRLTEANHRRLKVYAAQNGFKLNDAIDKLLERTETPRNGSKEARE